MSQENDDKKGYNSFEDENEENYEHEYEDENDDESDIAFNEMTVLGVKTLMLSDNTFCKNIDNLLYQSGDK